MEYYQIIQTRAGQTAAVINEQVPALKVGALTAADLLTQSAALTELAQVRDLRLSDFDGRVNSEFAGYSLLRRMVLSLPLVAEGELNEDVPEEAALLDKLDPVYAVVPDTTAAAMRRGLKLKAALVAINAYLSVQVPARDLITSGSGGLAELSAALTAQPSLEEAVETEAQNVSTARSNLRLAARELDRLNKRFYKKLVSLARDNPALADALGQIETENADQPATLGIRKILQGGTGGLQLLISYDNASYDPELTNTVEWQVQGVDAEFSHTAPADPSGNALGPFAAGQVVKLRTRTRNANGTTTGSIRTLTVAAPV